jgi:hypothetical protein
MSALGARIRTVKHQLKWILPLAGIPATYLAGAYLVTQSQELPEVAMILLVLAGFLLAIVGPVVCLVFAVRGGYRSFRAFRRKNGHFTKSESAARELQRQHQDGFANAQHLTRNLADNRPPFPLEVWGVVLRPGETAYLNLPADYARFYGGAGTYEHVSGFFWGSPAFLVAGYGLTALGNASRRKAAEAEARQRWREYQLAQVIATDQRLLCLANGLWQTFDFSMVTACYPEPENHSLVFEFPGAEPLLIAGPNAPLIAALSVWRLHGADGLRHHPALAPLRR